MFPTDKTVAICEQKMRPKGDHVNRIYKSMQKMRLKGDHVNRVYNEAKGRSREQGT